MRTWLCLLALSACSSDMPGGTDGGGGGGGGGGGAGDGPPSGGAVTALVDTGFQPVANARVVFQAADGTVIADTMTDAGGSASAVVEAGGFVTVVSPPDGLQTIAGVAPGDALVFHRQNRNGAPTQFPITVPSNPGSTLYSVGMTCDGIAVIDVGSSGHDTQGSDSVTGTGQVTNCTSGMVDMLIYPTDIEAGGLALIARDVPVGSGVPVVITGSYAPNVQAEIDATNVPDGYAQLAFEYDVHTPRGELLSSEFFDGSAMVVDGKQSGSMTVPAGDYAFVDREALQPGSGFDKLDAFGWGPSNSPQLARDLSGADLPGFTTVPQFAAATHTLTWQASAGTATPDLTFGWVSATRGTTQWQWQISAPYTAGAVTYPVLPVSGFDYNIATSDTAANAFTALLAIPAGTAAGVRAGIFASDNSENVFDAIRVGSAGQMFIMQCDHGNGCQ